jgi:Aerobic-type carbon monoxide dehydrogenase, small subunit CoxS/CutS homologs
MTDIPPHISRRVLGMASILTAVLGRDLAAQPAGARDVNPPPGAPLPGGTMKVRLTVNDQPRELSVDPRTTLLDALRDHLELTGTKKGCDHGQCGACTVLVNGMRMNACLSLAAQRDGDRIVTIEGLARGQELHPMQAAFVKHDGFQCGYCTPGQICSAVGMLAEIKQGMPSAASGDITAASDVTPEEVRERMSGNICRCSAYPNIVAAIMDAKGGST